MTQKHPGGRPRQNMHRVPLNVALGDDTVAQVSAVDREEFDAQVDEVARAWGGTWYERGRPNRSAIIRELLRREVARVRAAAGS